MPLVRQLSLQSKTHPLSLRNQELSVFFNQRVCLLTTSRLWTGKNRYLSRSGPSWMCDPFFWGKQSGKRGSFFRISPEHDCCAAGLVWSCAFQVVTSLPLSVDYCYFLSCIVTSGLSSLFVHAPFSTVSNGRDTSFVQWFTAKKSSYDSNGQSPTEMAYGLFIFRQMNFIQFCQVG